MPNKKKHLLYEERFLIEKMLKKKNHLVLIANTLDRSLAAISQEVRNNGGRQGYNAVESQKKASIKQNRKKEGSIKVLQSSSLKRFVDVNLSKGLSPEAISKSLKNQNQIEYVSPKSIRKYIFQTKRKYVDK